VVGYRDSALHYLNGTAGTKEEIVKILVQISELIDEVFPNTPVLASFGEPIMVTPQFKRHIRPIFETGMMAVVATKMLFKKSQNGDDNQLKTQPSESAPMALAKLSFFTEDLGVSRSNNSLSPLTGTHYFSWHDLLSKYLSSHPN